MKQKVFKITIAGILSCSMLLLSTPLYSFATEEIEIEDITTTEAEEGIEDAVDTIEEIVDVIEEEELTISTDTLKEIEGDLQEGADNISNVSENLEITIEILDNLPTIENADDEVQTVADNIQSFNDLNDSTTEKAEDTIDYAKTANTTDDEDEAIQAKEDAIQTLALTEEEFVKTENAYNVASDAVTAIDEKYQEALETKDKIEEQLSKAQEELEEAGTNSIAAQENLKAAQEKIDQLDAEMIKLAQSKEDLTALQDQYYKLLVHYYRDNGINSAVYNEDGTLNIEKSAEKAVENNKVNDPKVTENTLKLGRELMKDLVYYKLEANGAEDIQFAIKEDGLSKKQSADGELTQDNKGNDKVIIGETQDQYWDYPSGDGGRHHNVKVTYTITDEEGNKQEITEYYNYIYKAKKYEDDIDTLADGPIYLAKIDPENQGVEQDTDINNMDNYTKLSDELNKAIEASKVINEYNNAKNAVDAAKTKVDTLKDQIEELLKNDFTFNDTEVKLLEKQLKQANENLKQVTKDKEKLEEKVEEARKAVASISLDRFNKIIIDEPSDEIIENKEEEKTTPIIIEEEESKVINNKKEKIEIIINDPPILETKEEIVTSPVLEETLEVINNEEEQLQVDNIAVPAPVIIDNPIPAIIDNVVQPQTQEIETTIIENEEAALAETINQDEPILTELKDNTKTIKYEIEKTSNSNYLFFYLFLILFLIIILIIIFITDRINDNKKG